MKNGIQKEVDNLKRYYSECVRHYLRQYVSTLEVGSSPRFRNNVEKTDWVACNSVAINLNPQEFALLIELYTIGDTLPDKICQISKDKRIPQSYLWALVDDLEYKVAKKRGLI